MLDITIIFTIFITEKITLISKIECESSGVTVLEAGEFLAEKKPEKVEEPQDDEDEDADDLVSEHG